MRLRPSNHLLAIDPRAALHVSEGPAPEASRAGCVCIEGPLEQRPNCFYQSYADILAAFRLAAASDSLEITLRINSPGGVTSGLFETCYAMRAVADECGKPVVAYVDESACSAAYALACVADRIVLPRSGTVGSVGVITELTDVSEMLGASGIRVEVLTTGEEKADGHPAVPLSDETIARVQSRISEMAEQFYEWVSDRRALTVDEVRGLQAGVLSGEAAVSAGLADEMGSALALPSTLTRSSLMAEPAARKRMLEESETTRKTKKYAEDDSDDTAEGAAAGASDDSDEAAKDGEDAESKAKSAAEGEPEEDEEEGDEAKAVASIAAAARAVTGYSDPRDVVGALAALGDNKAKIAELTARLARVESSGRRARVTEQVSAAIKAGKVAPAQKAWAIELGMTSPRSLKTYLDTSSVIVSQESVEPAPPAAPNASAGAEKIWRDMGLNDAQIAAAKAAATPSFRGN